LLESFVKVVAIVHARMGSTRLPNKVMKPIGGVPMIELLLSRLSLANELDHIVVATSLDPKNETLASHIEKLGYRCVRGSEDDVLQLYIDAAHASDADIVVRVTGDCPLIDPVLVDEVVSQFKLQHVDYLTNSLTPTYPDGLDIEVFRFSALERASFEATQPREREHVTPYIRESGHFVIANYANSQDCSDGRWIVDEPEDFDVIRAVFEYFHPRVDFSWEEVVALSRHSPALFETNRRFIRNEGAQKGMGQKLWKRAKRVIPGGNMLLSKRAEMFLPDQWPAYFSKAKGCKVWDLEGNQYIDMSIMGIGTNTLGYGHPEVDEAVLRTVQAGNMSTFNCPEEVYLAEKLIELHPWADMVRFARSGGEANAIAIRIARAASGKDKVAICGYHGWHDWYLSVNLVDREGLDGHLLPGLDPKGVPKDLQGTVLPFSYNNFEELEALVAQHDVGAIKMEVVRNNGPENNFLHKVRKLATEKGIVLIFDECTSGFRETFGGLHKKYGVEPDMAVFGKALGNGYAITAAIGRRQVMEAAQATFISSTFWTERVGPTAALKTLDVMERERSWDQITKTGVDIMSRWRALADSHGLKFSVAGLPAIASFSFDSPNALAYKTLITQEMLNKGYLASNLIFSSLAHAPDIIDGYFNELDPIFAMIKECEEDRNIMSLLKGPVCHAGFKRLN